MAVKNKSGRASNPQSQEQKSQQTDRAQLSEPVGGAVAVRDGLAPRHEPGSGEERDALHDNHGNQNAHSDEGHHIVPLKTYLLVFGALMVLLVLTLLVYFYDVTHYLPPQYAWLSIIIAMTVAIVKAVLVILFFMHVKFSSKLTWLFSSVAFVFVFIMFLLTMNDYLTRGMLETAGR